MFRAPPSHRTLIVQAAGHEVTLSLFDTQLHISYPADVSTMFDSPLKRLGTQIKPARCKRNIWHQRHGVTEHCDTPLELSMWRSRNTTPPYQGNEWVMVGPGCRNTLTEITDSAGMINRLFSQPTALQLSEEPQGKNIFWNTADGFAAVMTLKSPHRNNINNDFCDRQCITVLEWQSARKYFNVLYEKSGIH